jgi:hypothetical protein
MLILGAFATLGAGCEWIPPKNPNLVGAWIKTYYYGQALPSTPSIRFEWPSQSYGGNEKELHAATEI